MIFVTVGTHSQAFDRLVKAMDDLASTIEETVVIQRGSTDYRPLYAENFTWTTGQHMEQLTRDARVVVTHAAAGAIILCLRYNKPIIAVPRRQCHDEHFDDHQLQIATALSATGRVVVVSEPSVATLQAALDQAAKDQAAYTSSSALKVALRQQLVEWHPKTGSRFRKWFQFR